MNSRRSKGLGSIRKRIRSDGTTGYQLKVVIGERAFVRTVKREDAKTDKAAEKRLALFIAEIDRGEVQCKEAEAVAQSAQPTLGEWCEIFLRDYTRQDADGDATRQAYAAAFKHLTPELQNSKLSAVTTEALHTWLRDVHRSGRLDAKGPRGLSVSTVALIRAAVGSALSKAVKRKLLPSNPTPTLTDLNLGHGEAARERVKRAALSSGQIASAVQNFDPDTLLWVQIMAATALRPGEATALRLGDIDFARRLIRVERSAKRVVGGIRGQERLGSTKTKSSVREVPIGATLLAVLQAWRDRTEATLRQLAGIAEGVTPVRDLVEPEMCIFYADLATKETRSVPRPRASLGRKFKAAVTAAGLPPTTVPHSLRHSALTAMLAGDGTMPGVSVVDAAKIAGHARPSVTSDVYAHAVQANLTRGADLADALIAPAPSAQVVSIGERTK